MSENLPLPIWSRKGDPDDLIRRVDDWFASRSLSALAKAYGFHGAHLTGQHFAAALDEFAAAHWDFRNGRERDSTTILVQGDDNDRLILAAATELGLTQERPPTRLRYDAILVLGGLIRGCIVRPRYAAKLLQSGINAPLVIGLGGLRGLTDNETLLAQQLAIHATNEFDALEQGLQEVFAPNDSLKVAVSHGSVGVGQHSAWKLSRWRSGANEALEVCVLAAPSGNPQQRRANTVDTYQFWSKELRDESIRSVLIVTHPIYVIQQGCAAVIELGMNLGLDVETVGMDSATQNLGVNTQTWDAQGYLQEIRASIGSAYRLRTRALRP